MHSMDFNFMMICCGLLLCFYLFSEMFAYITCLLIPAYFTFRAFKEKTHENVQKRIMKYWICYGVLNYPIKFLSANLLGNDMITNLIQIIFFSNLYHPKSHLLEILLQPVQHFFVKFDRYLRVFTKSFFDGFEDVITSKN